MDNEDIFSSEFYDEEGNFVRTQMDIDREKKKLAEQKKKEEAEKQQALREVKRRAVIDKRRQDYERAHEEELERRRKREYMMSLPAWIKSMPAVALDAPPETGGNMAKMMYKMRGASAIPEEELEERRKNLARKKHTIELYGNIHQVFPYGKKAAHIAVIPLATKIGSSMVSRCISQAMKESRGDLGSSFVVDFAVAGNRLAQWYSTTTKQVLTLKILLNRILDQSLYGLTPPEVLPIVDKQRREHTVLNRKDPNYRLDVGIEEATSIYQFMSLGSGVVIYDCDRKDPEVVNAMSMLSDTLVLLVPASSQAAVLVAGFFADLEEFYTPQEIIDIKEKTIIAISGTSKSMGTTKGLKQLDEVARRCAEITGVKQSRRIAIPYDPALRRPPLYWSKLHFGTKHAFRKLCAMAIVDVAGHAEI